MILVFTRLNDSRIGRAWVAIREDETAAAAMGINTVRLKLLAFAIGRLPGRRGRHGQRPRRHAGRRPSCTASSSRSLLLAAVVLGGMGTMPGALLGADARCSCIPEKLRAFQDTRLLLFGVALILMMRFRPEGIVPSRRRQRELHESDGADALRARRRGAACDAP